MNLVMNACDAMDEPGHAAHPHAARRRAACASSSATTVPASPKEIRDRIFEPFFTTKARRAGDRPRALDLPRHRRAPRRPPLGRVGARPGRHLRDRAAPRGARRRCRLGLGRAPTRGAMSPAAKLRLRRVSAAGAVAWALARPGPRGGGAAPGAGRLHAAAPDLGHRRRRGRLLGRRARRRAAGVEVGDRVLAVDGVPVNEWFRQPRLGGAPRPACRRAGRSRSRRRVGAASRCCRCPREVAFQHLMLPVLLASFAVGIAYLGARRARLAAEARPRRELGVPAVLLGDGDAALQRGPHLRRAVRLRAHARQPAVPRRHHLPPLHDLPGRARLDRALPGRARRRATPLAAVAALLTLFGISFGCRSELFPFLAYGCAMRGRRGRRGVAGARVGALAAQRRRGARRRGVLGRGAELRAGARCCSRRGSSSACCFPTSLGAGLVRRAAGLGRATASPGTSSSRSAASRAPPPPTAPRRSPSPASSRS